MVMGESNQMIENANFSAYFSVIGFSKVTKIAFLSRLESGKVKELPAETKRLLEDAEINQNT
jgi:hypothetical protein